MYFIWILYSKWSAGFDENLCWNGLLDRIEYFSVWLMVLTSGLFPIYSLDFHVIIGFCLWGLLITKNQFFIWKISLYTGHQVNMRLWLPTHQHYPSYLRIDLYNWNTGWSLTYSKAAYHQVERLRCYLAQVICAYRRIYVNSGHNRWSFSDYLRRKALTYPEVQLFFRFKHFCLTFGQSPYEHRREHFLMQDKITVYPKK